MTVSKVEQAFYKESEKSMSYLHWERHRYSVALLMLLHVTRFSIHSAQILFVEVGVHSNKFYMWEASVPPCLCSRSAELVCTEKWGSLKSYIWCTSVHELFFENWLVIHIQSFPILLGMFWKHDRGWLTVLSYAYPYLSGSKRAYKQSSNARDSMGYLCCHSTEQLFGWKHTASTSKVA